jgi:NADH-quinone oxidoreductase subunit C
MTTGSGEGSPTTTLSTPRAAELARNSKLLELLRSKLGAFLVESCLDLGDVVVRVSKGKLLDLCKLLKLDSELQFNLLSDITIVDWMDSRSERFEVVYHLGSLPLKHRLRIKVVVSEEQPSIDSVTSVWKGANFMEREAWDMYGVTFTGHPDLRRILMYDEFVGHPLRKDYPIQGKQPRVALRAPEVRNTGLDMKREPLVKINSNRKPQGDASPGDAGRFVATKWE